MVLLIHFGADVGEALRILQEFSSNKLLKSRVLHTCAYEARLLAATYKFNVKPSIETKL